METGPRCVVGAVVLDPRTRRVLAARRTTAPVGAWEFPGGKVEPGETPRQALVREVAEELGCQVDVGAELTDSGRPWPVSERYELRLFAARVESGSPRPGDSHDALRWLRADELDEVTWLPSDARALPVVAGLLRATDW